MQVETPTSGGAGDPGRLSEGRVAEIVLRMVSRLATETDFQRVVDVTLGEVVSLLGAAMAHVCAASDDGATLHLVGGANLPPDLTMRLQRFRVSDRFLASRAATSRQIEIVNARDQLEPDGELYAALVRYQCESMLAVPLQVGDELLGVLTYSLRQRHTFDAPELAAIRAFAGMLAAAMHRARTHEKLLREVAERERTEAVLRHREGELRAVVEGASDGVFLADTDGRYTQVNPAGERMLGYGPGELLGKTIADVIRPADLPRLAQQRERVLAGAVITNEWVMLRKDGSEVDIEVSTRLLPNGRWIGLTRDVTARRREHNALAESESRFRLTVDNAPIGMAIVALDGRFMRVNNALAEMVGYSPRELEALHFQDISHPDDLQSDLTLTEKLYRGEIQRFSLPKRYVRKDGRTIHVVLHGSIVRDTEGKPLHYIAQVEDVSERLRAEHEREEILEQLQAERAWLRAVIDESPVGILIAEGDGSPRLKPNRQLEEMLGLSVSTMADTDRNTQLFRRAEGPPIDPTSRPLLRALRGERVSREEFVLPRADGTNLTVRVNAAPIFLDSSRTVRGAVVLVDDVTAEKELERLREEWLSVVAHDLRNPLNTIATHAQLLARRAARAGPADVGAEAATSVRHILTAARRLGRMVNDLLESSRLEAHRLQIEPRATALEPFVRAVAERMLGEAADHAVRVDVEPGMPSVRIDPERVEQVLGNLISNAAKYGEPRTEIRVDARRRDGWAVISVSNRGRGITPEELPRLFNRFQRSEATRGSGVPGLGLGLYICRGIVEAHGGRIWAESAPNEETAFHFTLPFAAQG